MCDIRQANILKLLAFLDFGFVFRIRLLVVARIIADLARSIGN